MRSIGLLMVAARSNARSVGGNNGRTKQHMERDQADRETVAWCRAVVGQVGVAEV